LKKFLSIITVFMLLATQVFAGIDTLTCVGRGETRTCSAPGSYVTIAQTAAVSATSATPTHTLETVGTGLTSVAHDLTFTDQTLPSCGPISQENCAYALFLTGQVIGGVDATDDMVIAPTSDGRVVLAYLDTTNQLHVFLYDEELVTASWGKRITRLGGIFAVAISKDVADDGTKIPICVEGSSEIACFTLSLATGAPANQFAVADTGATEPFSIHSDSVPDSAIRSSHLFAPGSIDDGTETDATAWDYNPATPTIQAHRFNFPGTGDSEAYDIATSGSTEAVMMLSDTNGDTTKNLATLQEIDLVADTTTCFFGFGVTPGEEFGDPGVFEDPTTNNWVAMVINLQEGDVYFFEPSPGSCLVVYGPGKFDTGQEINVVTFEMRKRGTNARAAAGGSDVLVFDVPLSGLPASVQALRLPAPGKLKSMHVNAFGDTVVATGDPLSTVFLLTNSNPPSPTLSINNDKTALRYAFISDGAIGQPNMITLGSSNATGSSYDLSGGTVPEFSLTTMLMAVLISGFILMFVIRRRK